MTVRPSGQAAAGSTQEMTTIERFVATSHTNRADREYSQKEKRYVERQREE
jgi:hypothetical protein